MLYVYREKDLLGNVLLVKAETQDEVNAKLKVVETYNYLGCLTDSEINALDVGKFAVVTL